MITSRKRDFSHKFASPAPGRLAAHHGRDMLLRMADAFYDPALYEALHRGNDGDVEFYVGACAGGLSVLELGCGAGRLSRALLDSGCEVLGVDRHRGLLERAAKQGVVTHEADITTLDLERHFDRVIFPYNGLYCLLSDEEVTRCLTAARRHLRPGGELLLDVWYADAFHEESPREDAEYEVTESVGSCSVDGQTYDVLEQSRWDPERQRLDVSYLYLQGDDLMHTGRIQQRYLLTKQLRAFITEAGFSQVTMTGGFAGQAVGAEGEPTVIRASH